MSIVLGALWLASTALEAHATTSAAPPSPSRWDIATMCGLAVAGALYALGSARLTRRGARVRASERVAFWIGWAAMALAVSPPVDGLAANLFSLHMAQHELLMLVGAPLMVAGRPVVPWLWALPEMGRSRAGSSLQNVSITRLWRMLSAPVVACGVHGLTIWLWHLPGPHEAALRNEAVHAFQHATFVGTSICFWWGLVYGRYGRAAYGASAFYVFVTSLHTGVLGALFTLSSSPFYPLYATRTTATGVDAVADQQLAGLYMWIPAGMVLMLAGLALLVAWLAESERRVALPASRPSLGTEDVGRDPASFSPRL